MEQTVEEKEEETCIQICANGRWRDENSPIEAGTVRRKKRSPHGSTVTVTSRWLQLLRCEEEEEEEEEERKETLRLEKPESGRKRSEVPERDSAGARRRSRRWEKKKEKPPCVRLKAAASFPTNQRR
ncbi:uncharacterized protein V6R79_019833 [Siganus canaliculatus]